MFIQTDRQTDEREAVRQTDRQADRLAEEKTEMDRQNCAHRACVYMKSMAYESLYIFTFSGNALRQVLKHCNNNIAGNRLLRRSVGASCCSSSYSKVVAVRSSPGHFTGAAQAVSGLRLSQRLFPGQTQTLMPHTLPTLEG